MDTREMACKEIKEYRAQREREVMEA